ncbi:MAG: MerR family transcriptional regulator [Clostridium sp.]|uniref:MerR family transcriptional regulator n=1 Tax=Clostridium sp. TaxID=1506 RepID=UPI002FC607AA
MNYTVGDVAKKVGLSSYTLRYYEKEGLLPNVARSDKGIRVYSDSDITWIELIKCLKSTGMSISEIRSIVELSLEGDGTIPTRKDILLNHRAKLELQIEDLVKCINKIDNKLDWYDGKSTKC